VTPDSVSAAVGMAGMAAIQVRLPDDLDTTIPAGIQILSGGAAANTLELPISR
jgi:hypothetical protein